MLRVVIDTNVFIDWLNDGIHADVLFRRDAVKYMSSVVLMELHAGALSAQDRKLVDRLAGTFKGADRVLTPSAGVYEDAGRVLAALQARYGYDQTGVRTVANDVLIALSARAIGATVVTQNEQDFRTIQRIRPFGLIVPTEGAVKN